MDAASTHLALRITARVSLLLFLWAFAASAVARLLPNRTTQWLESNRRSAVLAFAASHTVHLGLILTLAAQMGAAQFIHTFTWVTVIVGGVGFALIYALAWMALRGTNATAERPRFTAFAYYYLWSIFALAYVGAAFRARFYVPFGLVVVAALALRLAAVLQPRKASTISIGPAMRQ